MAAPVVGGAVDDGGVARLYGGGIANVAVLSMDAFDPMLPDRSLR